MFTNYLVLKLIVQGLAAPLVSIDCISCRENNVFFISRSSIVKLLGSCSDCGRHVAYHWQALQCDGSSLELNELTTTTGRNQSNLVLRRNVLKNNCTYIFELSASSELHAAVGSARLIMNPTLPPAGGVCWMEAPSVIVALTDMLTVICIGWQAATNSSDPLQYHIFVEDPESGDTSCERTSFPIYRGIQQKASFFLSPFHSEKGEVTLTVHVVDQYGTKAAGLTR